MELFFLFILLILFIPMGYAGIIGAPLALTSKSQIEKIIKIVNLGNNDIFYELGTGTGRVITAFAEKNIKIIGFELSPIFYFITLINLKIHKIKNYRLYYKNFFNANLEEANVIFCFLMPKTMEKLKDKFMKELKSGTKIISYAFKIKGWSPYAIIKDNKKPTVYFYQIK